MDDLLINQYFQEIKNSLFYTTLATKCSTRYLNGFTNFFKDQSLEEYLHSEKLLRHLIYNKISLSKIYLIDFELETAGITNKEFITKILNESLRREKENSQNFKKIMNYIEKNKEYSHQDIILWFIKEQIQEENSFQKLIKKFENSNLNVYLLDKELTKEEDSDSDND